MSIDLVKERRIMDDITVIVGMLIRQHRKSRQLTQDDLATAIKVARTTIVAIENGEQNIHIERLYKISQALEMPIQCFFPNTEAHQELVDIEREYELRMKAWREKYAESS